MNNKNKPRVSIGVPVYNGQKYLTQALDSILAQTYTDFEVIISDNASTDETQTICMEYAARDRRVQYCRNDKNLGAAPNFNRVFNLSSGEYFKWAAYDDIIAPEFLSKCVEVLDQDPEVVLCFSQSKIVDEIGKLLEERRPYEADVSSSKPHVRFHNLALNMGNTALPVFGLMRASVVRKTGLIGSYPSSDLVFLAETALYGQFYEIPEDLFFWRYHPEQSTKGALRVERDRVAWFDTSSTGRVLLPKWQYLLGYLGAIHNAPLNRDERLHCYMDMVRWILIPAHFRAMGKDVLLAVAKIIHASLNKPGIRSHSQGGSL